MWTGRKGFDSQRLCSKENSSILFSYSQWGTSMTFKVTLDARVESIGIKDLKRFNIHVNMK